MRQFRVRIIDVGELYYGRIGIYVSFSVPINRVGTTKLIDLVKLCNSTANDILQLDDGVIFSKLVNGKRKDIPVKEIKDDLMANLA